jgi:hypothetical protein
LDDFFTNPSGHPAVPPDKQKHKQATAQNGQAKNMRSKKEIKKIEKCVSSL